MDPKVFKALELAVVGALLIVVLYLGGVFNDGESPIPASTPLPFVTENVPVSQPTLAQAAVTKPAATTAVQQSATVAPTATVAPRPTLASTITYQIVSGDSCSSIAYEYNVTIESLIAANGLDANCFIVAGGTLSIPSP
jgi:LysM repeat protein